MSFHAPLIPNAFIWRRLHSLTGLWLTLYIIEHLFVNSQAALWVGDDGFGFVRAVNGIQDLPYLKVIELTLIGLPLLIHGWWGIKYIFTAKYNSFSTDGANPSLPQFGRNQAYTWQRITSWILLVGIIVHVAQMRFIEEPVFASIGTERFYMVRVNQDQGLLPLSERLGFNIYNQNEVQELKEKHSAEANRKADSLLSIQKQEEQDHWIEALEKRSLKTGQVIAVAPSFGTAELLMVRETFKSPMMIFLYTIFVLAACFHGFNGLWTFMIAWGITLTVKSQRLMRNLAIGLTVIMSFLGLAAIWGTYFINLKQ